ncbi:MAG: ribosome small subunit-dependent GTPase A [Clostridia bacterium]|nr:ribosome small subunit-dependent GTPase A [Clostridia bacterium]
MKTKSLDGKVVKIVSNRYTVRVDDGKEYRAYARGKLRLQGDIYVGDNVKIVFERGDAVIDAVKPRINQLVRPFVANVDSALIVVAKEPEPDMLLIDKIIINCYLEGIKPVLLYNKADLATEEEIEELFAPYKEHIDCVVLSALEKKGLEELSQYIEGNVVCFAGQSAVGKTSLLNAILDLNLKTDGLSAKIKRGKNTTRHVEIYKALGGDIMDTCGFSMLSIVSIEPEELIYYYPDFIKYQDECRFKSCTHREEPDCAVKRAVESGEISKERYQRYLDIYEEINEHKRRLYD